MKGYEPCHGATGACDHDLLSVVATVAGCAMAWGVPALRIYGWFVGFGVAFIVHLVLMKVAVPQPSPRLRGEGAA